DGKWSEYPGGYSDMLVQRGADLSGRRTATAAKVKPATGDAPVAQTSTPNPKRKLSFKEKHALETLPKQMATLQDEAKKLTGALADPGLYARDAKAFADKSARLAAIEADLAAAEEKWLELEILREEIEGA
ncbi:MAG TPA: ABC transporter ATP-binding protein, partial [Hyphomicrobium sp.]|nr:ABC transporter ATP-binding protein [Hyphomicrobium sp.]